MKAPPDAATWRKSSYSNPDNACVEVANTLDALRDSKNPTGPALSLPVFGIVNSIKAGHLNG